MMRILGDRVLVALEPEPEEVTTASGLVLIRDPDKFRTPTRGIVVALGEKSNTVDLDEARSAVHEWFLGRGEQLAAQGDGTVRVRYVADEVDRILMKMQPACFDVAVGDCVVFQPSAGDQFEQGGIDYVVLHEHEIIGVVQSTKQTEAA